MLERYAEAEKALKNALSNHDRAQGHVSAAKHHSKSVQLLICLCVPVCVCLCVLQYVWFIRYLRVYARVHACMCDTNGR